MKKAISLLILLGVVMTMVACSARNHKDQDGTSSKDSIKDNSTSSKVSSGEESSSKPEKEEPSASGDSKPAGNPDSKPTGGTDTSDDWKLVLVSAAHPIAQGDYPVELGVVSDPYKMDKRIIPTFQEMAKAAKADGITLNILSTYRLRSSSERLYNEKIAEYKAEGYNDQQAAVEAAAWVAPPGTSEHNTGLAVDLNSLEESFENTKTFAWLSKHAEEYGFVLRYPKDKVEITKINYEPWHYRYVGVEHAKKMNELGYCLEEYLEYLGQ